MSDQADDEQSQPDDEFQAAEPDSEQEHPETDADTSGDASDDESQGEESQDDTQKIRIRVKGAGGEDVDEEVTLADLKSGYMRQADYSRKTQELAQQRQQFHTQASQAITQELQRQAQELQRLQAAAYETLAPELQGVEWERLAAEDPALYVQMQAKAQRFQGLLGQLDQRMQQVAAAQQAEAAANAQRVMQANAAALRQDGFDLATYQQTLKQGLEYGFNPQEMHHLVDARWLRVLRDAGEYRKLKAAKPLAEKRVAEAKPTMKPGPAGGGQKNPDRMSTEEWVRWRNKQVRSR